MIFFTGRTRASRAARDMLEDFRKARTQAHDALMDSDYENFKIYKSQMLSFLDLEFVDAWGFKSTVFNYLTEEEKQNAMLVTDHEKAHLKLAALHRGITDGKSTEH